MSTTIDGSAGVTTNVGAVYNGIQSATAVASTSGTNIDFTSIPSWVKRITVMFNGVSTNGTSIPQVQIGSGSVTTSGYVASSSEVYSSTSATTSATSGFIIYSNIATFVFSGHCVLTNVSGNIWVASHVVANTAGTVLNIFGGGVITLGGTLDRLRITTVNGTDTFDAGSINIIYE